MPPPLRVGIQATGVIVPITLRSTLSAAKADEAQKTAPAAKRVASRVFFIDIFLSICVPHMDVH
ncbi:hypothetical protein D3C79_1070610 [compost metagenome]